MRTLKLTLAYDGTNYVGWQRQTNGLSIQQVLEEAFAPLMRRREPPTVAGAGRTDAGVHALGQVASVNVDFDASGVGRAARAQRAAAARHPRRRRRRRPPGFHARFHAIGKTYRYRMVTTPVVVAVRSAVRLARAGARKTSTRMREAAAALVGRHDFASFQAAARPCATRSARSIASTCARLPGEIVHRDRGRRLPPAHGARDRRHARRNRCRPARA